MKSSPPQARSPQSPAPNPHPPHTTGTPSSNRLSPISTDRVADSPASTAEVHQHVSLRMLRLLAGDTEKALEPIPHISPDGAGLLVAATLCAGHVSRSSQPAGRQAPRGRQRHSSRRSRGQPARARFAFAPQSVVLQKCVRLRCDRAVSTADRFSPGQQVSLYVEVENYHSQSTEKGYRTSLGSSYELLDDDGKRVAGGDVSRCRRLLPQPATRFPHSIFGLTLPEKIAPGQYQLAAGRERPPERQNRPCHGGVRNPRYVRSQPYIRVRSRTSYPLLDELARLLASMERYDAIVLGAGGVGSAALYSWPARGVRASASTASHPPHDRGSSHGQTRVIRQAYFEHPDYVPLLFESYRLWHELEQQIGRQLFHQVGLVEVGPADGVVVPGVLRAAAEHDLPSSS